MHSSFDVFRHLCTNLLFFIIFVTDTSDQDEPTYVDALRGVGVRQIACGSGHTVVLTTDGEVYTWGALLTE
jgi:hypothetical protein